MTSNEELHRRLKLVEQDKVEKELHDRDYKELKEDIAEIKDNQKWSMRLIIAQFLALITAMIVWLIASGPVPGVAP